MADVTAVAEPSAAPGLVGRGRGRLLPPPQPHRFLGSSLAYALVGLAWGRCVTTGVRAGASAGVARFPGPEQPIAGCLDAAGMSYHIYIYIYIHIYRHICDEVGMLLSLPEDPGLRTYAAW